MNLRFYSCPKCGCAALFRVAIAWSDGALRGWQFACPKCPWQTVQGTQTSDRLADHFSLKEF